MVPSGPNGKPDLRRWFGLAVMVLALVGAALALEIRSLADTAEESFTIQDLAPSLDSVTVAETSRGTQVTELTPNEGTIKTVYVHGQASDPNGCQDITNIAIVLYRAGRGEACTADLNDCYRALLGPADFDPGCNAQTQTLTFQKTFAVANFADPTDVGEFESDNWAAKATVYDGSSSASATVAFEMASLAAFSVAPSAISYGTLSLGGVSDGHEIVFTNTGNTAVDSDIQASSTQAGDMVADLPNYAAIPAGNARYSRTAGFAYAAGTPVSGTSTQSLALALPRQTDDGTAPTSSVFWKLQAPAQRVFGTYRNTLVFTAKAAGGGTVSHDWTALASLPVGPSTNLVSIAADADNHKMIVGNDRLFRTTDDGATWTELQPAGDVASYWYGLSSDQDGSVLLVADMKRLYLSHDSGASWSEAGPLAGVDQMWSSVASDATGQHLFAGSNWNSGSSGGRLFISSNGGTSWTEAKPAGEQILKWMSVAQSADGQRLLAVSFNDGSKVGRAYLSTNGGTSWSETGPSIGTNRYWSYAAMDDSGQHLAIGTGEDSGIYISSDYGASWSQKSIGSGWSVHNIRICHDGSKLAVAGGTRLYWMPFGGSWSSADPTGGAGYDNLQGIAMDSDASRIVTVGNPRLYQSDNSGGTWYPTDVFGNRHNPWSQMAVDDNGNHVVLTQGSRLFTTADGGTTWLERRPAGNLDYQWRVASDADGSNLIAGVSGGRLYTSSDSGATWTERQPAGAVNAYWIVLASDPTGQILIAGASNGRLYKSVNGGAGWTEMRPAGDSDQYWAALAMDPTGQKIVAMTSRVYISTNGGTSWSETGPTVGSDQAWYRVAMDASGQKILLSSTPDYEFGRLYLSTNGGTSWSETGPTPGTDNYWVLAAMDPTGQHMVAAIDWGRLWASDDYGSTWVETQPAGDADINWTVLTSSFGGGRLGAATGDGHVYLRWP